MCGTEGRAYFVFVKADCTLYFFVSLAAAVRWFAHDWLALTSAEEGVHILATVLSVIELGLKVRDLRNSNQYISPLFYSFLPPYHFP